MSGQIKVDFEHIFVTPLSLNCVVLQIMEALSSVKTAMREAIISGSIDGLNIFIYSC